MIHVCTGALSVENRLASRSVPATGCPICSGAQGFHPTVVALCRLLGGENEFGDVRSPIDSQVDEGARGAPLVEPVHMLSEQATQAVRDLGGKWFAPIHNGTHGPKERVNRLASERRAAVSTPETGERQQS